MTQDEARKSEDEYHSHADESNGEKVHVSIAPFITKEDLEGDATGDAKRKTHKRFCCWRLTKRQWIAALVGSILLVVGVALLVVFLAVIPAVFQHYADQVKLELTYMDITSLPTDANSNVVGVELSVHVSMDSSANARMDEAQATLYYDDKPFGAVTLPAQSFSKHNKSFDLLIRNSVEIADPAVFRALSRALVADTQVTIDTRAKVKAHAAGLSYGGLKLDREFTIKAFDQFEEPKPTVNSIKLSECTTDAYKMLINITLDNDSLVGIGDIGALNLSVYNQQTYLGQSISTNATLGLPRGAAAMEVELTMKRTPTIMAAMVAMVNGLLSGSVQFYITGNHPYATKAPLLSDAFAALNISMLYTDGLSKVTFNPTCNLLSILTGTR